MSHRNDERKTDILRFVERYLEQNGASPTTDIIAREMGIAKSTVSKYTARLIADGALERVGRYGLVCRDMPRPRARMKILGAVACGKPILAREDVLGYVTVDEDILGGDREYFALVADGNSMINAGIANGDIVYVEKRDYADDGEIVVALMEDEETGESRATLKRLFRDRKNRRFILHPENDALEDIIADDIRIIGVARRVLKKL